MPTNGLKHFVALALLLLAPAFTGTAAAADTNPALWRHQVTGDFDTVLSQIKTGLESAQFNITGEENLSRGLEKNRAVFGAGWNTIGFEHVTTLHFCSLVFNEKVFNMNMDWSILCPFKLVAYTLKRDPHKITLIMVRPTYIMRDDPDPRAHAVAKEIEQRIEEAVTGALMPAQ